MASINRKTRGEIVGERDEWQLATKGERSAGGWWPFKLQHMAAKKGSIPKRTFHFGFNGERLTGNRDARILSRYHPDLAAWVRDCLREFA